MAIHGQFTPVLANQSQNFNLVDSFS